MIAHQIVDTVIFASTKWLTTRSLKLLIDSNNYEEFIEFLQNKGSVVRVTSTVN
jgi:hypothetical protein